MKSISAELAADLDLECTTLARLWRVTRRDGTVLRFTDNVRPLEWNGFTYRSDITFTASSILTSRSLAAAQSMTVRFMINAAGITERDVRAKLYNDAAAEVFLINYEDPSHGVMSLFNGAFGRIKLSDKDVAEVEVVPSGAADQDSIGKEVYSSTCRASLGDARCTVDIEALKVAFTVTAVDASVFEAAELTQVDQYWTQGFVVWSTGDNAGTRGMVQASDQSDTSATLSASPLQPVQVGDTGFIYPGCDKLPATCFAKFNNLVNMRAEPQVPGYDILPGVAVGRIAG